VNTRTGNTPLRSLLFIASLCHRRPQRRAEYEALKPLNGNERPGFRAIGQVKAHSTARQDERYHE